MVHSQHWRLLQDLPVQSFPMIFMLHARQAKRANEIIGAMRRAPGRASWPALDDPVYAPTRKSAPLNTLGVAPNLRQNRFKYSSTHNAPAFRRRRSLATKEQLRQYFEVRFRTEKYGVPYFFGVSEATHGNRPQEQERVAVEDLNGGDPRADAGRRPFKPQTVLLPRRTAVGST